MIAQEFSKHYLENSGFIIFASGVSNSHETDKSLFLKESELIEKSILKNKTFVYFSTTSIVGNKTEYIKHKENMELQIISNSKNYLIVRLPQVVGHTKNKNTLTNYLFKKIFNGEEFIVQRYAKRNLVDVEDVSAITRYILNNNIFRNEIINIGSPYWIDMVKLIQIFEAGLNKKTNYSIENTGEEYIFDTSVSLEVAKKIDIDFRPNYVSRILKKYYPFVN